MCLSTVICAEMFFIAKIFKDMNIAGILIYIPFFTDTYLVGHQEKLTANNQIHRVPSLCVGPCTCCNRSKVSSSFVFGIVNVNVKICSYDTLITLPA